MNRRVFNESLVASLNLPAGEREELLARARTEGAAFAKGLVSRGLLSPESLRHAYETLCGIPPFRGEAAEVRTVPAETLPLSFLRARLLVPVSLAAGTTGGGGGVLGGTEEEVREAIEKMYGESASSMERLVEQVGEEGEEIQTEDEKVERLIGVASEAPIIRLGNFILARAIERGASDIHLEPYEKTLRVRDRIDGSLLDGGAP